MQELGNIREQIAYDLYISIDLGINGYIVGANHTKSKLIRHFKEEI